MKIYIITYRSMLTGLPMWVTGIEPSNHEEATSPIISASTSRKAAAQYTKAEAEQFLPEVLKCHPAAVIVEDDQHEEAHPTLSL